MRYCPYCRAEMMEYPVGGRMRLSCSDPQCGYVFWNNPTPVIACVIEYDGKVLLARNAKWKNDFYGLITGFLEAGESPEDGALREMFEEVGLRGEIISHIGNYSFFEQNQLIIALHVIGYGEIKLNKELSQYKLLAHDQVQPWPRATGLALRDWLAKRST